MKVVYILLAVASIFVLSTGLKAAESSPQQTVAIGEALFVLIMARIVQAEYFGNKAIANKKEELADEEE